MITLGPFELRPNPSLVTADELFFKRGAKNDATTAVTGFKYTLSLIDCVSDNTLTVINICVT